MMRYPLLILGAMCVGLMSIATSMAATAQTRTYALNHHVLRAVNSMPKGGGYSVNRAAMTRLAEKGAVWNERRGTLDINAHAARPSFCSSACYLVLVKSLQSWEREQRVRFSPEFWRFMQPRVGQPDGDGGWGRLNANGPALAKWTYELRAGVNFTDIRQARPGDFLKIFWNEEIGARERGHFVVFLGADLAGGNPSLTFWSSNMGEGYGRKTIPLSEAKRLVFTRITRPAQFNAFARLPVKDEWLSSLLKTKVSSRDAYRRCGIR